MKYDTVLFDADGTLLDFVRSEREAFRETMALHNIDVSESMIDAYSRINDSLWKKLERREIERSVLLYRRFEMFCECYGYKNVDTRRMAVEYIKIIATKGYTLSGAEELLEKLFGKVRMYIVTNGAEYVQRGRYARTGIGKYFDGLFISECIGYNKPDERFFEYVAKNIKGFNKKRTLIVGDSLTSDIKGGKRFGIDTCWYDPEKYQAVAELEPTFTTYDFDDVYKVIVGEEE